MDAIETLMNEHRLIEHVMEALVAFADEVRRKAADDRTELGRFVTFLRDFADVRHHGKEEKILFAAMIEAGFPPRGGPVAVMLAEHDQGRILVHTLDELASQAAPWSDDDRQRLARVANGHAELLRAHIHKQDAVLYPMAEQHLSPERLARVAADCDRYEAETTGSGEHDRLHRLAGELLARHAPLIRDEPPGRTVHLGCCG